MSKIGSPHTAIAVVIATMGRPDIVAGTIKRILGRQTLQPALILVSCTKLEDAGDLAEFPEVTILIGPAGLAAQRNTALSHLPESIEIIVFFDDDFVPAANWLNLAARVFNTDRGIIGFTGEVISDGIKGPGLSFEEADRIIYDAESVECVPQILPFSPYGCNMAFRRSAIGELRFDERLVLYGWLEDRDFGARLKWKGGELIKCTQAQGVHLGIKSGRISGNRLGYSQVVNPIYMYRKGTMTLVQVIDHLFRNISSNILGSISPEYYIDRRGRLRGNLIGAIDVLLGRFEPERAKMRF